VLFRSGAAQTLTISAEPGTELMRFHIAWFEPSLFDSPYSLGEKVYLFDRGREDYDERRYGDVVSLGRRLPNRWYAELAATVEGVEVRDVDDDAPPEVKEVEGSHALLGLKGTLVKDRTDSRWMPTTGDRLRVSYEQVTGDFQFGRATGDYRVYRTVRVDALDRKHVLAGRLGAGNVFGDAPVFERFYGGGQDSVRGFKYRGISPRSRAGDDPIGGEFMFFAGTEYEFPLVGEKLRGVLFLDSGTVERRFELTTYRTSVGFGIRWIIPLLGTVPMDLDFGFPLTKDKDDDTQIFSFNIGWTF
jgi:outer membrane protein insertion porin family